MKTQKQQPSQRNEYKGNYWQKVIAEHKKADLKLANRGVNYA